MGRRVGDRHLAVAQCAPVSKLVPAGPVPEPTPPAPLSTLPRPHTSRRRPCNDGKPCPFPPEPKVPMVEGGSRCLRRRRPASASDAHCGAGEGDGRSGPICPHEPAATTSRRRLPATHTVPLPRPPPASRTRWFKLVPRCRYPRRRRPPDSAVTAAVGPTRAAGKGSSPAVRSVT